jgi:hypothetical protein
MSLEIDKFEQADNNGDDDAVDVEAFLKGARRTRQIDENELQAVLASLDDEEARTTL